jgi:MotA/TolQ/ExbB proton channel family
MGRFFDGVWEENLPLVKAIWVDNTAVGKAIIVTIGVLLIASLISATLHIRRYKKFETSNLDQVIGRLRRWLQTASAPDDNANNKRPLKHYQSLSDLEKFKEGIPANSIIGDRLRAIAKMRGSQVKVNVSALQQMSIAKESSRFGLGIPGFATGFAMLLGLLGTVAGLTLLVQNISMALPPGTQGINPTLWGQSMAKIGDVLGSMKTAFSATLVGLFCSVCSSAANFRLGRVQSVFFEKLERFTIEELLPATVPALEDESLIEQVSLQLENSFTQLNDISQQNSETLKELNAIEKSFLTIVSNVQGIARNGNSGVVHEVVGKMTGVINEISEVGRFTTKMAESLPSLLTVIQQSNQSLLKKLDEVKTSNERQGQSLSRFAEDLPAVVGSLRQSNQSLSKRVDELIQLNRGPQARIAENESRLLSVNSVIGIITILILIVICYALMR